MYSKKNGRISFRSNRRTSYKRNSNFSNGKVRNKGNLAQQYQKYIKLAKESSVSGDRIQSEYYFQFADHYSRLMVELGITVDENNTNNEIKLSSNDAIESAVENINSADNDSEESFKSEDKGEEESIESVSFLADPVKPKSPRSKKQTS